MSQTPIIWNGSSTFSSGQTPFGFYDTDTNFQTDADKVAQFCASRLGYPTVDVEMGSGSFYACFEEAVTTYGNELYLYQIRNNFINLEAANTGSELNQSVTNPNLGNVIRLAENYGSEAGSGGNVTWYSGSIPLTASVQEYDLNAWKDTQGITGSIEIKTVFYQNTPAIVRYFDPYAGTGAGTMNMLDQFGFGNYSPAVTFLMMPVYADMLRLQAIELNDQVRKSAYSFDIKNNQMRIFPIPTTSSSLWIDYVLTSDRDNPLRTRFSGSADVVSDYSNARYDFMQYNKINDVGKQWIRKYGLALSKELLGIVRSKYGTIPIPNAEVSLDGDTLRAEATAEKEQLMEQLRETLEQTSRKALMEAQKDESDFQQETLKKVPYPVYIG